MKNPNDEMEEIMRQENEGISDEDLKIKQLAKIFVDIVENSPAYQNKENIMDGKEEFVPKPISFVNTIRERRKEMGLTQGDVARFIGHTSEKRTQNGRKAQPPQI